MSKFSTFIIAACALAAGFDLGMMEHREDVRVERLQQRLKTCITEMNLQTDMKADCLKENDELREAIQKVIGEE